MEFGGWWGILFERHRIDRIAMSASYTRFIINVPDRGNSNGASLGNLGAGRMRLLQLPAKTSAQPSSEQTDRDREIILVKEGLETCFCEQITGALD